MKALEKHNIVSRDKETGEIRHFIFYGEHFEVVEEVPVAPTNVWKDMEFIYV